MFRKKVDTNLVIKPFKEKKFSHNPLLYLTERISIDPRELYRRSYILTDSQGMLLRETGNLFDEQGYNIYVFDPFDMKNTMHYNPIAYIQNPADIKYLARALLKNLRRNQRMPVEPFFEELIFLWLQATIKYLWFEESPEKQNLPALLKLVEADYNGELEILFENLEYDVREWKIYRNMLYKQELSYKILESLEELLKPFSVPEITELFSYDELRFDTYGDQKSILYVTTKDMDNSYDFIISLLFSQMFYVLLVKVDENGGRRNTHVQFLLDEFNWYK